jgi:hypothetical protein
LRVNCGKGSQRVASIDNCALGEVTSWLLWPALLDFRLHLSPDLQIGLPEFVGIFGHPARRLPWSEPPLALSIQVLQVALSPSLETATDIARRQVWPTRVNQASRTAILFRASPDPVDGLSLAIPIMFRIRKRSWPLLSDCLPSSSAHRHPMFDTECHWETGWPSRAEHP